jgi:competence protein ComEC
MRPTPVQGLLLVALAGAWLAGIVLASFVPVPAVSSTLFVVAASALVALLCAFLFRADPQGHLILLLTGCLLLGAVRYIAALPYGDPQAISAFISQQSIIVRGSVSDEPKVEGRHRILVVDTQSISTDDRSSWHDVHGHIEALLPGTSIEDPYGANYGDTIELQGILQPPLPHSSPDIFASIAFPRSRVDASGGNPLIAFLYHLRIQLATIILRALPQPEAALLIALLLSMRTPALTPLIPSFNVTGTAHLIAPSGFKVTILAGIIQNSTRWLYEGQSRSRSVNALRQRQRNWRYWLATLPVILSIAAYTLLSGGGPAALRAGIMGVLLVLAPRIGRTYNVYTALAFTAWLLSLLDPFVLWDTGFLLSFLGTLGIVLLTPFLQRFFQPLTRLPFGHVLAEIFAVTMAAQIATLPIFALTFQQISFIAPLANLLTVPLLGTFILAGLLVCGAGLLSPLLALLYGWIAWPLLWYLITAVSWCANLPGAYITIDGLNTTIGWCYYGLLALVITFLLRRGMLSIGTAQHQIPSSSTHLPCHFLYKAQGVAAVIVVLATGTVAVASPPDSHVRISFLAVAPAGQPPQGEAILLQTPDGKTALIDGGLDATSLATLLDSRLPSWQRSLDLVILTSPRAAHLSGLQDVVNRYQIGKVLDAGMLHPTATYALWRRNIRERGIPYAQLQQGNTVTLGTQVTLQVLWPLYSLHKSNDEGRDNALILRLLAPGLRLLLLGATTFSTYALNNVLQDTASNLLRADIVQIIGEIGKPFLPEVIQVILRAQPSLLIVTPDALSKPKQQASSVGEPSTILSPPGLSSVTVNTAIRVIQTAQVGTLEISSDERGWSIQNA